MEELTKDKRKDAKKSAAKTKKSGRQRGLLTQCSCGGTVPITPGTVCGYCKVRTPENLKAKGKQPCQGCGREEVRADEACSTCHYMWTNPDAAPKESAYTQGEKTTRKCKHCREDTPKSNDFCDHCDKEKKTGLTKEELIEAAAIGATTGPSESREKGAEKRGKEVMETAQDKRARRAQATRQKREEKIAQKRGMVRQGRRVEGTDDDMSGCDDEPSPRSPRQPPRSYPPPSQPPPPPPHPPSYKKTKGSPKWQAPSDEAVRPPSKQPGKYTLRKNVDERKMKKEYDEIDRRWSKNWAEFDNRLTRNRKERTFTDDVARAVHDKKIDRAKKTGVFKRETDKKITNPEKEKEQRRLMEISKKQSEDPAFVPPDEVKVNVPAFVPPDFHNRGSAVGARFAFAEKPDDEVSSDSDLASCIVHTKRALNNVFRTHGRLPPKNEQPSVFFRRANHYVPRHHLF